MSVCSLQKKLIFHVKMNIMFLKPSVKCVCVAKQNTHPFQGVLICCVVHISIQSQFSMLEGYVLTCMRSCSLVGKVCM